MNDLAGLLGFVLLALGVAQCFFGYRIFRFLLGLSGFVVGAALGAMLARNASAFEAILTVLALGVLGATLAVWAYLVGIFLTGAFVGGALGALFGALADSEGAAMGLGLIGGIVGGIIALQVQKFIIIVSTAAQGAASIVGGALLTVTPELLSRSPDRILRAFLGEEGLPFGAWLLLLIAGVVVQYRSTSKTPAVSGAAEYPPERATESGPHLSIVRGGSEAGATSTPAPQVSVPALPREERGPEPPEPRHSVAAQRREAAAADTSSVRPGSTTPATTARTETGIPGSVPRSKPSHDGGAWTWPGAGG